MEYFSAKEIFSLRKDDSLQMISYPARVHILFPVTWGFHGIKEHTIGTDAFERLGMLIFAEIVSGNVTVLKCDLSDITSSVCLGYFIRWTHGTASRLKWYRLNLIKRMNFNYFWQSFGSATKKSLAVPFCCWQIFWESQWTSSRGLHLRAQLSNRCPAGHEKCLRRPFSHP